MAIAGTGSPFDHDPFWFLALALNDIAWVFSNLPWLIARAFGK